MSKSINRRSFLHKTGNSLAVLGIAASAPSIVPNSVLGKNPPSDRVVAGVIGLGCRGFDHLIACLRNEQVRVAALADLDLSYLMGGVEFTDTQMSVDRVWSYRKDGWMTLRGEVPKNGIEPYLDYRGLLERKDIDAVCIAIPDHWHAKAYIDAMEAGKHVYGEKPLAQTVRQGRKIVDAVKRTGKVFQTGLQQRSHYNFQRTCELVRNGYLGKIEKVVMRIGGTVFRKPVPDALPPGGLNYEMWLGPAPLIPYNPLRCHFNFRYFFEFGGGAVTDIGAHECDIAQWALDKDQTGPHYVEGRAKRPGGAFNTFGEFEFTLTYDDGAKLIFSSVDGFDIKFYGSKGNLFVSRSKMETTPTDILKTPLKPGDKRFVPEGGSGYEDEGASYRASTSGHVQNWIDCIRSGNQPTVTAETGHRTTTICHIANICGLVGRKLEWDPVKEQFVNDNEANALLDVPQRPPYAL